MRAFLFVKNVVKYKYVEKNVTKSEQQCRELGSKIQKEEENKYGSYYGGFAFEPKYIFNKTIDTCVYSGGGFTGTFSWERFVKNILTNENIISIYVPDIRNIDETKSKDIKVYYDMEIQLMR